jgi:hypothetical protein
MTCSYPYVNLKWLLHVAFYIPFPNIYVCIETQEMGSLFQQYLEEEDAARKYLVFGEEQGKTS